MEIKGNREMNAICLWCGESTESEKSLEHIFPKSIGGKETLPLGSVHKKCTDDLNIDKFLKKGHIALMDAFQVDNQIKGYKRKSKDKERKQKERTDIKGIGDARHTRIQRDSKDIHLVNPVFVVSSREFIRALHKCFVNVLCSIYGSRNTRANYRELLSFVKDGGDILPWSYAVSYPNPFNRPLISEPKTLVSMLRGDRISIVSFIHTSGIWILGAYPFSLSSLVIENLSEMIVKNMSHIKEPVTKKPITDFFGFGYESNTIGKLKFLWTGENRAENKS